MMTDYCKGCRWEFDFKHCQNDYKHEMVKDKDGRLMCGYCQWKKKCLNY